MLEFIGAVGPAAVDVLVTAVGVVVVIVTVAVAVVVAVVAVVVAVTVYDDWLHSAICCYNC